MGSLTRRRRGWWIAAAAALIAVTACSSSHPASSASSTTTTAAAPASTTSSKTVWLCRPGQAGDPCLTSPDATVIAADGTRTVQRSTTPTTSPTVDCFYVYPTVSTEAGDNADLTVQPAERTAAISQASRFSSVCRVFAPMYRQRTLRSLAAGLGKDPQADTIAYDSLLSAWHDYLAHDNHGTPIVFIGHSQGAALLIRLIRDEVDPSPALRARVVSAILLGGNVSVATGKQTGGSFEHLPVCTSPTVPGCVIAYSSFGSQPPADSLFGRPGQGVSLQSGQTQVAGLQVACVDPVASGTALDPYFLAATARTAGVGTPWVEYPGLYTASCQDTGGATWLQLTPTPGPGDARPLVRATQGPEWGFHVDDVNLALGNLVADVAAQAHAYAAGHA